MITIGATAGRVFAGLLIASVLGITVGVLIRYFHVFEKLTLPTNNPVVAGVANRWAAGGHLLVRDR
jgi:ABC-type nitrate/sulfonate/bicarbonate transport system permease component